MKRNHKESRLVRMRICLAVCAAVLLALALLATAGCGSSDEGTEQQVQEQEQEQQQEQQAEDNDTEGGEVTPPSNGGGTDGGGTSTSGGNTEFSLDPQEIGAGNTAAQYKLADVTWADHGEYFRIVFELESADGGEITETPYCNTWYVTEFHDLAISLNNIVTYKLDYAPFADAGVPVSLGDALVETIQRMDTADTEPVVFEVMCSYSPAHPGVSSRPHRLMYMTNPMRVILDIQKT